jgi:phosphomevalonate kinase
VSDARRKTDLQWFRENFGSAVKTVRVVADDDVRKERGWQFTTGKNNFLSSLKFK